MRKIKVKTPLNLKTKDYCYFKNNKYKLFALNTFELNDVIITNEGICLNNDNIIYETIHWYRDKIAISQLSAKLSLQKLKTYYYNNTNYYLHIQGPLFSYYHWITESIPRLWMLYDQLSELVLLLPEALKNIDYVTDSIKPFTFKDIQYIPQNINIKIKNLILPQIKPFYTIYYPEVVQELRDFYLKESLSKGCSDLIPRKKFIYLCNNNDKKYEIINQNEVEALLKQYNIEIINLFHFKFYDQILMISNVNTVVSVNQDDMACISFMKPGSSVLELNKFPENENEYHFTRYWKLSSVLDLNYYYQLCDYTENQINYNFPKITVDVRLLETNISKMLMRRIS